VTKEEFVMIFANWTLVILTIVLVIVTIYYAVYTRRMTKIMEREFELRIAPFLVFDCSPYQVGKSNRTYRLKISNKGSLARNIKEVVLEFWPMGQPERTKQKVARINKLLGPDDPPIDLIGDEISITRNDIITENSEKESETNLNQILKSYQGKVYCIYIDIDGNEQKTGEKFFETL
jgi:hypothetical protein